jgi:hypothetical protein
MSSFAITYSTPIFLLYEVAELYQMTLPPRDPGGQVLSLRMWLLRILPLCFTYQISVLGPTFLAKFGYTGNLMNLATTTEAAEVFEGGHSCLAAKHPVTGATAYAKDEAPFMCACPSFAEGGTLFGSLWRHEASKEYRVELGSVPDAAFAAWDQGLDGHSKWVWTGQSGDLFAPANAQRTWH